jgi:hypothetical protein
LFENNLHALLFANGRDGNVDTPDLTHLNDVELRR